MKGLLSALLSNTRLQGKGVFLETEYMSLIYWGIRRNVIDIFHISLLMHYLIHSKHIRAAAHVQAGCVIHVQFVRSSPGRLEALHKSKSLGNRSALAQPYNLNMPV